MPPVLGCGSLVLSIPLWWGRRAVLFSYIVVIHHCIVLGLSDHLSRLAVLEVHRRTDVSSWVWVLKAINWMGLLNPTQCMGVSYAVYMVNRQGQLLQEERAGST